MTQHQLDRAAERIAVEFSNLAIAAGLILAAAGVRLVLRRLFNGRVVEVGPEGAPGSIPASVQQAAGRLGINLNSVSISNGVARVRIGFTEQIGLQDIRAVVQHLRQRGAQTIVIDSGAIINPRAAAMVLQEGSAAQIGRITGGQATITRLPDVVPTGPPMGVPAVGTPSPRVEITIRLD